VTADPGPGRAPDPAAARRQAGRLLRWYPRAWRDRYGEEFAELLVADIADRPRCLARSADVARSGMLARLALAGLAGCGLADGGDPARARSRHVAASLGTLAAVSAVFLVIGVAQSSQLLIGWVWTARARQQVAGGLPPALAVGRNAMLGASAGIGILLVLGLLAALPVLAAVAAQLARPRLPGQRGRLAWPAAVLAAALAGLVIGARSVENSWTGTGGLHSPVPGGLAAFAWAITVFVSAYWAHPGLLAAFPVAERGWMALTPLLLAAAVASALLLVRRVGLSPRVARFEAGLGIACCAVMTAFTGLCTAWLAAAGPLSGPAGEFHAGWVNVGATAVLALALLAGWRAVRVARRNLAAPPLPAS
jgi:hypothetical protein